MIRTYFFYFVLVSYLLLSGFAYLWYLLIGLFSKKLQYDYIHKMTASWGRIMVALSSSKVELVNLQKIPEGNVLYVSNHQSNYDIPLLLGYLPKPKAYVAKIELSKVPIISHWMRVMGCLFLDRGNLKQSLKVILQGVEDLKNGKTLVIFPEGTRSKNYTMGDFKKGSLKLGIRAGVPIVPITIDGSFKMYEAKKAITKDHVRIIVHDPIYPNQLSKEEQDNLSDTVRNIIMSPIFHLQ